MTNLKNEPVGIAGGIIVLVTAGIFLVTAFGLNVTPDQSAAIIGVVTAVTSLVTLIVTRSKVTPTVNVAAQVNSSTGVIVAGPAAVQNTGAVVDVTSATPEELA